MSLQEDFLASLFPTQERGGGQTDDRYLWPEMLRVIDEIRPTWVVGENVAGITTMVESCEITDLGGEASLFEEDNGVHRFRAEHAFTIERICRDLESKGYSVQPVLIPACAVGAPHRRDRVFIVAYSSGSGSESHAQDKRAEGNGGREYAQQGEWSEQTEFNNGLHSFSRFANNTDCRDDLREAGEAGEAGEDARKSRKERNEVWGPGESDNVRSEDEGSSSNANSWRGSEVDKYLQSEFSDGAEPVCNGGKWDAADSNSKRLQKRMWARLCENSEEERARVDNRAERFGYDGRPTEMLPGERWKGFPTVSAVYRGNDGLPFDVDDLAISFSKWRNESLKAYGNAIVPQVMYRIFQCIEEIYQ